MLPPVHLLVGDDDLLLHRALEQLLTRLREAEPDLHVESAHVGEADHLPEMRTASLFGGRTCVVLRGAEGLTGDLKTEVEHYLEDPSPDAVLVIVARGLGRIPKIGKLAAAAGERTDVKVPMDWDERGWQRLVGEEFRRLGRKADASAIAAIQAHAGSDPAAIASKVGQVVAAHTDAATLTAEHVESVVEGHGRQSGFAVADAVAERDPAGALVALRGALESGQAPLAILGAVIFRLRQLLLVRSGAGPKEAGMSQGQHRRSQALAQRFTPGELAWCHDRLAQLDVDLKGAELPDDLLLELGILEVATTRQVGPPWNPLAARP